MNRIHLGDALDHWKGSMFRWLKPALSDLHVVPMFTDDDPPTTWTPAHLAFYARLLQVAPRQILNPMVRFEHRSRGQYFTSLEPPAHADLFFDPDTGIAIDSRAHAKHIMPSELSVFLPAESGRALLVYQHAWRTKDYARTTLSRLANCSTLRGTEAFAYGAGNVALILISRDHARLTALRRAIGDLPAPDAWIVRLRSARPSSP